MHTLLRNALAALPLFIFAIWFWLVPKPVLTVFVIMAAILAVSGGIAIYRVTRARGQQ